MSPNEGRIIAAAIKLIKAMQAERDAMPKSFEAPKTVDAAGQLKAALNDIGFEFDKPSIIVIT